jgi:hypothetical protein
MSGHTGIYERIFGPRLRSALEGPSPAGAEEAQALCGSVCEALRVAYTSMPPWMPYFEAERLDQHDYDIVCQWHPNHEAREVFERARALGCTWAWEQEGLIDEERPKSRRLAREGTVPAP